MKHFYFKNTIHLDTLFISELSLYYNPRQHMTNRQKKVACVELTFIIIWKWMSGTLNFYKNNFIRTRGSLLFKS